MLFLLCFVLALVIGAVHLYRDKQTRTNARVAEIFLDRDNALAKSERRAREKADCVDVALGRHGYVGYLTNFDSIRGKDGRAYQWRV